MAMGETFRIEMDVDVKDNTEPGLSRAEKKISSFDKAMKSVEDRLHKMGNTKVNMALDAVDKASAVIKKVRSSVKDLAGKVFRTTISVIDKATAPIRGILNLLANPLLAAGAVLGVSIGVTDSIDTFKGFEAAMSQVKAISGATAEQMDLLNAKAKEMGATTKFTATEAGEAFNYMAMAGWETGDMLNGIEGILNLAAASGESLGTTSDIVTDALTAFGLKAGDAGHFADVLAVASSSANTNVSMMGETFKYVGAASGALGYSIEDVALGIGLMANSGIKASQAGTELNSIFTRLSTDTNGARKAIEALGVSFYRSDGSARAFGDVMLDLREATKEMTQEEKMNFANKVAGMRAQAGLLAMLNATTGDYNKLTQAIKASDGASKDMADTMLDNLEGSLTLLQSAVDGAKMNLGERLSPYLREFADWLTSVMPQVNKAIDSVMDFVDEKIENLKNRIGEMTAGMDWQDADFFGKVKIAWDTIIAEPFSEWWNTSGKAMMAEKAASIGQGIGAAISSGLMGLLGIDIGGAADEGASIGMAFGKGLASGFDIQGLKSKVWDAIKSLFSNAADILPGGDSAKLSSWLSAALIAKMGKGMIGAGWKAADIGKKIAGSSVMGSFSLAEDLSGAVAASGGGILGLLGKTGLALGSGATTGAGLVAAGGGAIAGGAVGGAAVISGLKDLSIALKEREDTEKSNAYGESSAWKIGGVGGGAAAGAAIGSFFGGIGAVPGALIGAGIGGIAGWIKGKKAVEEYQEAVDKAALADQEAALKAALATEQAKYASQELKDALANGVSDSEFAYMLQKIESDNLKSHFGDITLSLEEIKSLAQSIIIPKEAASNLDTFAWASQSAEKSLENLKNSITAMEKLNWRAGLGLELDETDMESYKAGIDNLISSAEQYLDSKHFEASMALNILVDEGDPSGIIAGVDAMYAKLQDELNSVGEELTAQVNIALEDGVIDADEQKIIAELQQKVREITERVSNAELDAKMQVLNMKYSGAQLDYDSFSSLQQELATQVQAYTDQYQEALTVGITALNLELDDNAISNEEYNAAVQELQNNYQASIEDMQVKVESFQLDAIAGAYSDALDGLLPEMQGTTAEKLSAGLHDAIASGIDAADWNADTVRQFLGLENLQTEAAEELAQLMGMVMETVPTQMVEAIRETADPVAIGEPVTEILDEGIAAGVENMDASQAGQVIVDKVGESIVLAGNEGLGRVTKEMVDGAFRDMDFSESAEVMVENLAGNIEAVDSSAIPQAVGNQVNTSLEDLDLLPAAESILGNLTGSLAEADYTAIGEMLLGGMMGYFEEADFAELGMMLTVHIAESLTAEENLAMLETAAQTMASATDTYLNNEFSLNVGNEAGNDVPGNISQSLDRNKENVHPGCDAIVLEVDSYLTGQLNSLTVNASPTVNITPKYVVNGDPPDLAGRVGVVRANATGGIVSGKQLSWVGEEGPEMIIPLVSGRRPRALELYEKAGEMLGVDQNADGGIIGLNESSVPVQVPDGRGKNNGNSGENRVVVEMSVAPNINISSGSGSDAEEIRRMVEQTIRNMMEDVSDGLSRKLTRQMANMGMV